MSSTSETGAIRADTAKRMAVPTGAPHYTIRDTALRGFAVRAFPSGARRFLFMGRVKGTNTRRTITIGDASVLTAAQARTEAERHRIAFSNGEDPVAAQEAERIAQAARQTFGELAEQYFDAFETGGLRRQKRKPRPESVRSERKDLNRAVALIGAETPAADVDERTLNLMILNLSKLAPATRKKTFGVVSRVLMLGVQAGALDRNPALGVEAPAGSEPRKRYLSEDELRRVWDACADLGAYGRLVRFLIAQPVRLSIGRELQHSAVTDGTMTVASDAKGNKAREQWTLPLTALALAQIGDGSGWVFRGRNGGAVAATTDLKARLDKASGVTDWVLHDLRRTVETLLADNVTDVDVDAVQQWTLHKRTGMAGVYQRSQRKAAMQRIATQWNAVLGRIIGVDSGVERVTKLKA